MTFLFSLLATFAVKFHGESSAKTLDGDNAKAVNNGKVDNEGSEMI